MKTRSKRLAFFAILSALVLSLCFVFMACGESGESGGTTQTEVTITKLSVRISASNKTTYYKGESFDASLTVLRADYSDGSVRHFLPEREEGCTMTPAVFAAGITRGIQTHHSVITAARQYCRAADFMIRERRVTSKCGKTVE